MKRDIHIWFGLSYAQYLTVPRSVLQSMPREWQEKFVELLEELDDTNWTNLLPEKTCYKVELKGYHYNDKSEFKWNKGNIPDPLANYDRGRRYVFRENMKPSHKCLDCSYEMNSKKSHIIDGLRCEKCEGPLVPID